LTAALMFFNYDSKTKSFNEESKWGMSHC
jgi:hypothetical protein